MATGTLTLHQRAVRSTVAWKAVMAVSGLIFILYLLAHMYGNFKLFAGQQAFDDYSHHLRVIGEPVLPYGGLLWILRVVLLVAVVLHIVAATRLAVRSRRAVNGLGRRYQSRKHPRGVKRTYASFTMRWGGVIIALFVLFHILHLTLNVIAPGGAQPSPYVRTVVGFQHWWVFAVYAIAMAAIAFHVRHGLWSAFATLGANTSPGVQTKLNAVALVIAVLLLVGFLAGPFAVSIGVLP